jgi:hypothetical protein
MNALAFSESPVARLESTPFDLSALMSSRQPIKFLDSEGVSQVFTPDDTKAFFIFESAYGFPAGESIYSTSFHPNTIAASYKTLLNGSLDYEHRLMVNDPKLQNDHFVGSVVAVSFPGNHSAGGWKINESSPHITGVGVLWKRAQGMRRILGEHLTGHHQWAVSYDALWGGEEKNATVQQVLAKTSSFAVQLPKDGKPELGFSPPDFLEAGWEYIPGNEAPKDLLNTTTSGDGTAFRVDKQWHGRKVVVLMNDQVGHVHFSGLAIVRYGAEKAAGIRSVVASGTSPLAESISELGNVVGKIFAGKIVKS